MAGWGSSICVDDPHRKSIAQVPAGKAVHSAQAVTENPRCGALT